MHELEYSPAFQIIFALFIDWITPEAWRQDIRLSGERLIQRLEYGLYIAHASEQERMQQGVLAVVMTLIPLTALMYLLVSAPLIGWLVNCMLLGLCLGWSRQRRYIPSLTAALQQNELIHARYLIERMNPATRKGELQEPDTGADLLIANTIRWTLDCGCHRLLGVIFWFLLLGGPGAVIYRLLLEFRDHWTLQHHRYQSFGRPAAVLAKLFDWAPLHLTVLTYSLAGRARQSWQSLRHQNPDYPVHINQHDLITAGCGSMGIVLAPNTQQSNDKPVYSTSPLRPAVAGDCERARNLLNICCLGWLVIISLGHFL